ncbi:group I truncated hemoglobin [Roseateles sp. BYS87W]|uniref:Group 1 truncated hemoglobin n=1 Tax=Pelomonas baiyunensis TaxID=3299026 RepID=A0ABW7H552_9BURK
MLVNPFPAVRRVSLCAGLAAWAAVAGWTPAAAASDDATGAQSGTRPRVVVPGAAPLPADDQLFQALGGVERIRRFTDDFYDRMLNDARIARYFEGIRKDALQRALADYFCVVAGGPCTYEGVNMKDAHAHLGIDRAAFNALVENLQAALDAAQVPFSIQNRFLARMAHFHRDIVTR